MIKSFNNNNNDFFDITKNEEIKRIKKIGKIARNKLNIIHFFSNALDGIPDIMIGICFIHQKHALSTETIQWLLKNYGEWNYERYEFVGDAVLKMILTDHIYMENKNKQENAYDLATKRKDLENNKIQACYMEQFENACLHIIKDVDIAVNFKDCADVFEAIIGMIYIYLRTKKKMKYECMEIIQDWLTNNINIYEKNILCNNKQVQKENETMVKKSISNIEQKQKEKNIENNLKRLYLRSIQKQDMIKYDNKALFFIGYIFNRENNKKIEIIQFSLRSIPSGKLGIKPIYPKYGIDNDNDMVGVVTNVMYNYVRFLYNTKDEFYNNILMRCYQKTSIGCFYHNNNDNILYICYPFTQLEMEKLFMNQDIFLYFFPLDVIAKDPTYYILDSSLRNNIYDLIQINCFKKYR